MNKITSYDGKKNFLMKANDEWALIPIDMWLKKQELILPKYKSRNSLFQTST